MKELVVAAVQMESAMGDVHANATMIRGWLEKAAREGAQLVFFPECCLTGYSTAQADEVAIPAVIDEAIDLEKRACELGVAVGYGYIERKMPEDETACLGGASCVTSLDKPYVTYVVSGRNERLIYRKTHLGSRELQAFRVGNELPVARISGVNIGVQLCWEAHIPDITTALRAKEAELVLMPHASGSGGEHRIELWNRYLPARAYDNGMYVIACNALGRDKAGDLVGGGMAAYGPAGACLCSNASTSEGMLLVEVGGILPREAPDCGMHNISYFDRRRPKLYAIM